MDLFTDAMRSLRMREFRPGISERRAPWGTYYPRNSWDVMFYAVSGRPCWLTLDDGSEPIYLSENTICILPHGHGHSLRDSLETVAEPVRHLRPPGYYGTMKFGSETGPATKVYMGRFKMDQVGRNPFWDALPSIILVKADAQPSWLETMFAWFREELTECRIGHGAVVCRIAELLILQSIRLYIANSNDGATLLSALSDPHLRRTLEIIHNSGEQSWTVQSLALAVGTSRSRLAARFSAHFGEGPLHYLSRWRLHKAALLLGETDLKISAIVEMIGYQSEPSFNLAFKKANGITPGRYRALARGHDDVDKQDDSFMPSPLDPFAVARVS